MSEKVNHPAHYGGDTVYEVIKVLQAWLTTDEFIGFCKGNSIKYLARHRSKGGAEDLKKAEWYDKCLNNFIAEVGAEHANEPERLYWSDELHETPDIDEVQHQHSGYIPYMISSNVEPYVNWFINVPTDDGYEYHRFDNRAAAQFASQEYVASQIETAKKAKKAKKNDDNKS